MSSANWIYSQYCYSHPFLRYDPNISNVNRCCLISVLKQPGEIVSPAPTCSLLKLEFQLSISPVPNYLSIKECESFIQYAASLGFQHQGSRGPAYGEAFRDNGRVSVLSPALAESLWEAGLKSIFNDIQVYGRRAVGLNPNLRFYRYTAGQRFGQHIDESVELGGGLATEYTLLIYLTGGEESSATGKASRDKLLGGETVFYDGRRVVAEVPPVAGMALFHIHGQHCMLHEARVVAKGVKYILRSDVVFSKP